MTTDKSKAVRQDIDPRRIKVPAIRITTVWTDDELEAFKRDVENEGIETPLLIAKCGDELLVIDGKHRLEEALIKGLKTVPCSVREMDMATMLLRNIASNRHRGKAPVSDEIKVVKELMNTHNYGVEQIEKGTGFSRERVETLMLIAAGHPGILDALDAEIIQIGHAKALLKLPRDTQINYYLNICAQYRPAVKDLTSMVNETLRLEAEMSKQPPPMPVNETPQEIKGRCSCCKGEFPVEFLVSPVICHNCNGAMFEVVSLAKQRSKDRGRAAQNPDSDRVAEE